mgnify:FL=1
MALSHTVRLRSRMAMRVPNQNPIVAVWRPRSDPTGLVIVQLGAFFLEREF